MERCPICRARLRGAGVCPRCGADLALALAAEYRAQVLERAAVDCIARGDRPRAEQVLEEALRLRSTPLARALLGFVRECTIEELPEA